MRGSLIPAKVNQSVTIARNCLPIILVERLNLGHVLDDGGCRDIPGAHGGKLSREPRQGHGRELIQQPVNVPGKRPVVNLVGAVIEGLKDLRI